MKIKIIYNDKIEIYDDISSFSYASSYHGLVNICFFSGNKFCIKLNNNVKEVVFVHDNND